MKLNDLIKLAFLAKTDKEKIEINNIIYERVNFSSVNCIYSIEELKDVTSEIDKNFNKNALYFYQANTDKGEAVSIDNIQEYFNRKWVLDLIVNSIYGNIELFADYFDFEPFITERFKRDLGEFYTLKELKTYLAKH